MPPIPTLTGAREFQVGAAVAFMHDDKIVVGLITKAPYVTDDGDLVIDVDKDGNAYPRVPTTRADVVTPVEVMRGDRALTAYTADLDMGCGPEVQVASLIADLLAVIEHMSESPLAVIEHAKEFYTESGGTL